MSKPDQISLGVLDDKYTVRLFSAGNDAALVIMSDEGIEHISTYKGVVTTEFINKMRETAEMWVDNNG